MWALDHKEGWAPKNWCFQIVVLDKTLESTLDSKEIKPVNPKWNQLWIFIGRTDAEAEVPNTLVTLCEELTHWKRTWCWEQLRAGGEEGDRRWDGWMASLTQWTWTWANSGRLWSTGKPGMPLSIGIEECDTTEWLNNNYYIQIDNQQGPNCSTGPVMGGERQYISSLSHLQTRLLGSRLIFQALLPAFLCDVNRWPSSMLPAAWRAASVLRRSVTLC